MILAIISNGILDYCKKLTHDLYRRGRRLQEARRPAGRRGRLGTAGPLPAGVVFLFLPVSPGKTSQ